MLPALLPCICCCLWSSRHSSSTRLWVTAEPHPQFPIGLLQMGIKITNEAPVGMKAGLRASYQWVNQDMLDAVGRWVRQGCWGPGGGGLRVMGMLSLSEEADICLSLQQRRLRQTKPATAAAAAAVLCRVLQARMAAVAFCYVLPP